MIEDGAIGPHVRRIPRAQCAVERAARPFSGHRVSEGRPNDPRQQCLLYTGHHFNTSSFPTPESMPKLPPGPSFILRQLFSWEVAGYSGFVYLLRVGTKKINVNVPLWAIASSSIVALPVLFLVRCQLDTWKNRRDARSLGARLVPTVPTKWLGGIDLVFAMINVFKTGYLGKF